QQALDVVVDPLRGLAELDRHLGARPGLGELPQRFDPLRLEQGLSLLDPVEVDDVSHDENQSLRKTIFCQYCNPDCNRPSCRALIPGRAATHPSARPRSGGGASPAGPCCHSLWGGWPAGRFRVTSVSFQQPSARSGFGVAEGGPSQWRRCAMRGCVRVAVIAVAIGAGAVPAGAAANASAASMATAPPGYQRVRSAPIPI